MDYTENVRKAYPELGELTTIFMEQDWTDDFDQTPGMLFIEIVAQMFREYTDKWLADEERSLAVQKEIKKVLEATSTTAECERELGIMNSLDEFCGVDIRCVLKNLANVLVTKGRVVY